MIFDRNENKPVIALLGAGALGNAIAKRIGTGKKILLGGANKERLDRTVDEYCREGYDAEGFQIDALDHEQIRAFAEKAASLGQVKYFIDAAGASPNQAAPELIVALDLVSTAVAIDEFAKIIAPGGAGLIVSSQTGYMMHFDQEIERQLALTPTDELADLPFVREDAIANQGIAYISAKRANQLRVRTAAATTWGDARARINSISPGVIVTPLAYDEFAAAGNNYQKMIDASPARRVGTPEEIGAAGAWLLSDEAAFVTGADLLIDGGVIAAIECGHYTLGQN